MGVPGLAVHHGLSGDRDRYQLDARLYDWHRRGFEVVERPIPPELLI